MSSADILLEVRDLRITTPVASGRHCLVDGVSFSLGRERLGIVGESGSGKSLTVRALMNLTPPALEVTAKQMSFCGEDLRAASAARWRSIRGRGIGLILQDPKFSLNPVMRVGEQIAETYRIHGRCSRGAARRRALEMLESVLIREPERVYRLYPHEVSGGMGQRAMIAMMLAAEPTLLFADEPTSALDADVQDQVLAVIDNLVRQRGMGLVLISHDLALVSRFCDRILVMYRGHIVERIESGDLASAKHPYTRALLEATPALSDARAELPTLKHCDEWLAAEAP